ncbi:hypothetical protein EYC84_005791 [Monilinia fructicola]|uniref:Uncharacterized protein n=1 Tax=Monilinia fructicola TaxID=38448 RepID=A0A5M9JXN7_MONFR|nr:hypothetical protein EYC84_005791 [Monilinia fructicola]
MLYCVHHRPPPLLVLKCQSIYNCPPNATSINKTLYWFLYVCQTAMPNGAPRNHSCQYANILSPGRTGSPELTESNNHESPVSDGKESGVWVEWNVASWSLWVMVW